MQETLGRLIPASSVFQVGHTRDRSESVFSILKTSVFESIFKTAVALCDGFC